MPEEAQSIDARSDHSFVMSSGADLNYSVNAIPYGLDVWSQR